MCVDDHQPASFHITLNASSSIARNTTNPMLVNSQVNIAVECMSSKQCGGVQQVSMQAMLVGIASVPESAQGLASGSEAIAKAETSNLHTCDTC